MLQGPVGIWEGRPGGEEGFRAGPDQGRWRPALGAGTSLGTGGHPMSCAPPLPRLAVPACVSHADGAPRGAPLCPSLRARGTASCLRSPGPGAGAQCPCLLLTAPAPPRPSPPRAPHFLFSFCRVAQGENSAWGLALWVSCVFVCLI